MAPIGAVLLAAGASRRFGPPSKLLADVGGEPLVRRVARVLAQSGLQEIVVVTGADHEACRRVLDDLPVRVILNADWPSGMGSSIAAGVAGLGSDLEGAFIVLGDMPFVSAEVLDGMAAAFERAGRGAIVYAATAAGEQRNPVLWPRHRFPALIALTGPDGAKRILQEALRDTVAVTVDERVLADIDTPGDLEAVRAGLSANRAQAR